jgi:hypothetical protein
MTNLCGIYKFNMKLAELETGYSPEVIQKQLNTLEEYEKIKLSKSSKEIMIVNWFKHNFKNNKRTKLSINKELRQVKDKDFLQRLYETCQYWDYPVDEIFKGVKLMAVEGEDKATKTSLQLDVLEEKLGVSEDGNIEEIGFVEEESEGLSVAFWSFGKNKLKDLDEKNIAVNDGKWRTNERLIKIPANNLVRKANFKY